MAYFQTLVREFKTNQSIKDAYTDALPRVVVPLTAGAVVGAAIAGPVGAFLGVIGSALFTAQGTPEPKPEDFESLLVMLDLLDYPQQERLVGIVQSAVGSCRVHDLTEKLKNRPGIYVVIGAVKKFKDLIEWKSVGLKSSHTHRQLE